MTQSHPELESEQAYIDSAYRHLLENRESAWRIRKLTEPDTGGTFQARFERNAFDEQLVRRLTALELGDAALIFGRIDRRIEPGDDTAGSTVRDANSEGFHIGRLAISNSESEPVVVDWRAPIAEPFYRATGRQPMGLVRRRHFAVEGPRLLDIEDELFGDGHLGLGHDDGLADGTVLRGHSTLLASLERGRTGTLGDIVATIQIEQDEIIRSPKAGVLVVQGGPGTGKTVVALHRAAYLLYTNRFPLEDQGVLVIGPNRVFLRYIERVLPSLGEAGIAQIVLSDLVSGVVFETGTTIDTAAKVKGDARMSDLIVRAIKDRERAIRDDITVPFGAGFLRLRASATALIVRQARRRFNHHNSARRWVEEQVWDALAATWRGPQAVTGNAVRDAVRRQPEIRAALEWMWPRLTPAELLHDLFGSNALLRSAGKGIFTPTELAALHRPRSSNLQTRRWTSADAALLDAAAAALGPIPRPDGSVDPHDEIRTYGHIVVDEVQDLTPMELKMVARRSLNGSMTVVGDIAQATGAHAPATWDDVLQYLPQRRQSRVIGLTVGYRIPSQITTLATKVMLAATPSLRAPESVRVGDWAPVIRHADDLVAAVVDEVRLRRHDLPDASIAVVAVAELTAQLSTALTAAGFDPTQAKRGLDQPLTVVPIELVKGLELDVAIVVEPSAIVAAHDLGLRALYVAMTRPTQHLSIVHHDALPAPLQT